MSGAPEGRGYDIIQFMPILLQLCETLRGRSTGPIRHSSGGSQVYIQVDIDEFLKSAPVVGY